MASWFDWSGQSNPTDSHETDPPLLKDHSEFKTYKTSRFEYPDLRIFYRQHSKADELPRDPAPLPLLVFIPGLGGSIAQFHPLLSSLTDLAPCLAIDYPGCGRSKFAVTDWDAYSTQAIVELLETIIEDYRDKEAGQGAVLIAHSMGTAICALLASKTSPHTTSLPEHIVGFVPICPVSHPLDEAKTVWARRLLWVPGWIFALWRAWDGMGGLNSPSVSRWVGDVPDHELRVLQYRFNQQSKTPVWRRMAGGSLANWVDGKPTGGLPTTEIWGSLDMPIYIVTGEKDAVTPPKMGEEIAQAIKSHNKQSASTSPSLSSLQGAGPVSLSSSPSEHIPHHVVDVQHNPPHRSQTPIEDPHETPSTPNDSAPDIPPQPTHPAMVIQTTVMPAPANHTLLYSPRTARALAGLIADFLCNNVTRRLSLAWQLQHLSREGKWDVKNLAKWKAVNPVSDPIGPPDEPIFRAMKTLREVDDVHCPTEFVARYGTVVRDVIDISKDQPVYDPRGLERAGIHYHKFPTVSKIPPTAEEVDSFITLVDKIRARQKERAHAEDWEEPRRTLIAVHCHYGFNRTGYFVVCYLVERCGFTLQDAIDVFAKARPPSGIRHSHFLDRLHVRYDLSGAK